MNNTEQIKYLFNLKDIFNHHIILNKNYYDKYLKRIFIIESNGKKSFNSFLSRIHVEDYLLKYNEIQSSYFGLLENYKIIFKKINGEHSNESNYYIINNFISIIEDKIIKFNKHINYFNSNYYSLRHDSIANYSKLLLDYIEELNNHFNLVINEIDNKTFYFNKNILKNNFVFNF